MKTIKILFICLVMASLFSSCADPKTFKDKNGKEFKAEPFGWANENSRKNDTVVYEINVGNVILDVLFCETAIVPVVLTGWQFYEPVRLKNMSEINQKTDYSGVLAGAVIFFLFAYFLWKRN